MSDPVDAGNLETFRILWLDALINNNENKAAQKQLRTVINHVKTFEDPVDFLHGVRHSTQTDRLVVIVSGRFSHHVIPKIHPLIQVISIYIYCMNKSHYEQHTQSYNKVKAICVELNELVHQIRLDHKNLSIMDDQLPFNIFSMNENDEQSSIELNGQFLYSQLLIDVLMQIKPNEKDKRELITLCRKSYKDNEKELDNVNRFDREYCPSQAITWYTSDCFLYRVLNKALRVQNINILYLFRSVILDINEQLKQAQAQKHIRVYRGQLMSNEELDRLRCSVGKFISINSFFSTSLNRDTTLLFLTTGIYANEHNHDKCFESVLFEIDADPVVVMSNSWNRPFANISTFSEFPSEDEVLFMLGSIFRLDDISYDQSSATVCNTLKTVKIIRMTLCNDQEKDLEQLYTVMKKYFSKAQTNNLLFGKLLVKMGKFNMAENYLCRSLGEFTSNDPSLADLYHLMGMVAGAQDNYNESLEWHRKSLTVCVQACAADHVNIGNSYNSMGIVYRKKGERIRALDSFNAAVSLFEQAHHENHQDMALLYGNIGNIYQEQKKYEDALKFDEKSLAIKTKYFPCVHADIGASYANIGVIYRCLGQYDQALDYYKRSLEIQLKSLPSEHLDIATTCKNIGILYKHKTEWKQALTYFEKASKLFHKLLPLQHPNVTKINTAIQYVSCQLNMQSIL
ncbi:unnamed protein product [Rotaria socialis]|uniref:ADP ribosyltransferase domain-containing protein n=1 Tax=Rotaria socialis TaxID=392032 RepID=A0A818YG49_9BILA|nr:unnamed protein product [Rotaria socialis]CAF3652686.1 unnamed protein product [Rotaria socialis]CAF3753986.1 unnamed protein product [Rotaria socialis]CAF4579209.1 unnamed protein product [Rotaria socialis]CAF4742372.1 unnamed protein product [Rotaria socialis]